MLTITQKIDFYKSCFGDNYKLQGDNINFLCPNCGDINNQKKLKFSICLETDMCHCWVCNIKGKTPKKIIRKFCNKSAYDKYLKLFNESEFTRDDNDLDKKDIEEKVVLPKGFELIANCNIKKDPDIRDCYKYLVSRGVSEEQMWYHKIGVVSKGKYARRVIFPSFDKDLNLNYFLSRTIDEESFKYLNSKNDKTKIAFDEMRINWQDEIILVEGVFDMLKCPKNCIPVLGNTISDNHYIFQSIVRNKSSVILAFDRDANDHKHNLADRLIKYGIQVKIINLQNYHDVGEMPSELVRQKCIEAPTYSSDSRLSYLISNIHSGSIF